MTWKDVFCGSNPDTGKRYFRRVRVSKVVKVPEPPPNFEEGTTFTLGKPPANLELKKVKPGITWIGIVGEEMDKREAKREGESGG